MQHKPPATNQPVLLRYGREGMWVSFPDDLDLQVLRLNPLPELGDVPVAIEDSLRSPLGGQSLDRLAKGRESACIVISDVTRPVPNSAILRPLLACLHDSGISRDKITLLVATGLHRPNEGAELAEMIGEDIATQYRVENHVARDPAGQSPVGEVPVGNNGHSVQAAINSTYLRSDLKITTGLIEPHLMAGYSGGRKLVCPGLASAATIKQFHSPPMIRHAAARAGNIDGNPVHAMSRRVAGIAGVDFICNVTLSEERAITGVFSGDLDQAHAAGVAHVERSTKVPCRLADIVVTTGAGYPLDTTLYQATKGMVGAVPAVKPGGTIILLANCVQGVGSPEFTELCDSLTTVEEFLERINHAPVGIDQWQLQEMMQVLQHCQVMLVAPALDIAAQRRALLTPMPSVEVALQSALARHGPTSTVTVIPEGPYVTPVAVVGL